MRVVGKGSWKKQEVGKFLFKLEWTDRSWKEPSEIESTNFTIFSSFYYYVITTHAVGYENRVDQPKSLIRYLVRIKNYDL